MAETKRHKILRIGIIQDAKIVQERLIKSGESVTVGDGAKNTFVIAGSTLGQAEFTLFRAMGPSYVLQFTETMKGKISSGGAVVALQKLIDDPAVSKKKGVITLPLTQQDRGKVVIDGVTVLFQFVNPPPAAAVIAIENMDFRPVWLEDDDPVFLGFLALWSIFAGILLIWVWLSPKREYQFDELPERFTSITVEKPDVVEDKPEIEEDLLQTDNGEATFEEKKKASDSDSSNDESKQNDKAAPNIGKKAESTDAAKSQEDARQEVLERSAMLVKLIGQRGEGATVISSMFDGGDAVDIDAVLSQTNGIATSADDMGTRSGKSLEGTDAAELDGLKQVKQGDGAGDGVGKEVVAVVKGSVRAGSGDVDIDGDASAASAVVKRYAGQLNYCYEKELKVDPTLEGRVEIAWVVGNTKVSSARVVSNSTGSSALGTCIVNRVRRWKFAPDAEGEMSWPFVFRPK